MYGYFDIGGGFNTARYSPFKAGVSLVIHRHVLSVSYNYLSRDFERLPSNFIYRSGYYLIEQMRFNSLVYGFTFKLNDFIRIVPRGGFILSGEYTYPSNFVNTKGGWFSGPSTQYDLFDKPLRGFIINPCTEFTLARCFGLSVGPSVVLTNQQNLVSIDASMLLGRVRNKRLKPEDTL